MKQAFRIPVMHIKQTGQINNYCAITMLEKRLIETTG